MSKELIQSASNVLQAPKSAAAVSVTTITTSLSDKLGIVPLNDIALFLGTVLSAVMIYIRVAKYLEYRKTSKLEREFLRLNVEEARQRSKDRREKERGK